jgi:hypothetical protein
MIIAWTMAALSTTLRRGITRTLFKGLRPVGGGHRLPAA